MDQLRQVWMVIRTQLAKLGPTERLLLGSFGVILVMGLFLASQYAGKPGLVPVLPGAAAADQQKAQVFLTSAGFSPKMQDGAVVVPADRKDEALAVLSANRQLPADTQSFFKTLVSSQSWSNTRQQNEQLYNAALKTELDRIVSNMPGIKSANVLFDVPEASGLGTAVRKPTASVAVVTETGGGLEQKMVDAIAYLVGGAKAGLSPERVRVIDPRGQRKATSEDDIVPTTYLEHAAKVEAETREKLTELLGYIPGVIVAVTAQVDVTRVVSKEQRMLAAGEGSQSFPKKETNKETEQHEMGKGSEAGVRSNQPADIARSTGNKGSGSKDTQTEKEYENHVGSRTAETVDPRGMPTMIAVSVNVPRGYVSGMLRTKDQATEPDEKAIADAFDKRVKPAIRESLLPHVKTMMTLSGVAAPDPKSVEQQIVVSLIPVDLVPMGPAVQEAGILGGLASGGGTLMGLSVGQIVDKAVMSVLAVGALGMMFVMVRKAGKKQEMPTPEELVGLPPALETRSDMIGEADEGDAPLAGIEMDEGDVKTAKMLEQVTKMVSDKPDEAARLLKRWITVEE